MCQFPLNFYISAQFRGTRYWPVIKNDKCRLKVTSSVEEGKQPTHDLLKGFRSPTGKASLVQDTCRFSFHTEHHSGSRWVADLNGYRHKSVSVGGHRCILACSGEPFGKAGSTGDGVYFASTIFCWRWPISFEMWVDLKPARTEFLK